MIYKLNTSKGTNTAAAGSSASRPNLWVERRSSHSEKREDSEGTSRWVERPGAESPVPAILGRVVVVVPTLQYWG